MSCRVGEQDSLLRPCPPDARRAGLRRRPPRRVRQLRRRQHRVPRWPTRHACGHDLRDAAATRLLARPRLRPTPLRRRRPMHPPTPNRRSSINADGTVTITHDYGTFDIPLEPERVLVLENRRDLETAVVLDLPLARRRHLRHRHRQRRRPVRAGRPRRGRDHQQLRAQPRTDRRTRSRPDPGAGHLPQRR